MTVKEKTIVIVGAGMTGMLGALFIKKRDPAARVLIVERANRAGGNYRGLDLPGFGYCDNAMRLIYETGIPEFDALLHGLLPPDEWHVLPDNIKDVVGAYWRGKLQTHSPYLDLRRLGEPQLRVCEREVFQRVNDPATSTVSEDATSYLNARFGPTTTAYVQRILEKFYGTPSDRLHWSAAVQPAMDRVILRSEEELKPLMRHDRTRSVIAWPDQLSLPVKRMPAQSGLYPRKFGIDRVIDSAYLQLQQLGVSFLFNRSVSRLEVVDGKVHSVELDDGSRIEQPALLISANGLPGSLALLAPQEPATKLSPTRCWQVYLRTRKPPELGGVYHFWCFEDAFSTFRVTNYSAYCPDARTTDGYPVCVEVWSDDSLPEQAKARAIRELQEMGVCREEELSASAVVPSVNMHSLCTLESVQKLRAMREQIRQLSPENMITVGPHMEDGVMLLYEVCRRMCALIPAPL